MGQPHSLLSFIFGIFKHIYIYVCVCVKQCPYSMYCQDSNLRPLEHESPPITTRSGRPTNFCLMIDREKELSFLAKPHERGHSDNYLFLKMAF